MLPAEPASAEKPYYAHLSDAGKRVDARGLEGSGTEPPRWSRFFRTVETRNATSPPVTGADGKPLLLLSRFGEGRVALLSDHIWLWARGYGGGPISTCRMSHWLMKQPDLDESALRLRSRGHDLVVLRQTMARTASAGEGDFARRVDARADAGCQRNGTTAHDDSPTGELGLWQATDGTLKA